MTDWQVGDETMSKGCGKRLCGWAGQRVRLLVTMLLLVVNTQAALLPRVPLINKWFYNGTHASPWCETTFRCDTSSRNKTLPVCSCHPNCSLYDACCEDLRPSDWPQRVLPQDAYECAVYPRLGFDVNGNITLSTAAFIYLITKCPSAHAGSCLARLCDMSSNDTSDGKLRLTWVTDQLTGVTYKNKFCAACHGLTSEKMVFWNHSYDCISDPLFERVGLSGCNHNVLLLNGIEEKLPQCPSRPYYTSCKTGSSPQQQDSCRNTPTRYIYDRESFATYRNYNCSLCGLSSNISFSGCTPNFVTICFLYMYVVPVSGVRGCLYEKVGCGAEEERKLSKKICAVNAFLTNDLLENTTAITSLPNVQHRPHRKSEGVSSGGGRILYGKLFVYFVLTRTFAYCEKV